MLFDLRSGKRRRVVQVVYGALAASFLIGFVFFGVGTGGLGSISDVLGIGQGSGGGSATSQFDDQIDAAKAKLAQHPKDERALLQLAKNEYYKGQRELDVDPSTNQPIPTDSSNADMGAAVDAWERYLKLAGPKVDVGSAGILVQAYAFLNDAAGAARTQQIVAKAEPSANSYGNLSVYLYFAGKMAAGDAAAKKALSEASASQRQQTKQFLDQVRTQAVKLAKAQKQAGAAGSTGAGANSLANPFGGLGGSSTPP